LLERAANGGSDQKAEGNKRVQPLGVSPQGQCYDKDVGIMRCQSLISKSMTYSMEYLSGLVLPY